MTSKKAAAAAAKTLRTDKKTAARTLVQPRGSKSRAGSSLAQTPVKRRGKPATPQPAARVRLPESVDDETIARLVAEAEKGIPAEKLRRRGRPTIGDDAASTYSVRLPVDLVTLTDARSALDGVSRGETMRRALIEYLTS
ncbi:hypothetical protein [Mycobacterium sp.]|uniref:hypothetical protein n=1 Tax=Mycobacterium sp. TaxID=1785 RepID=UPI0025FFE780|nr:hypothetical protein [Mycobacterium sp.]